MAKSDAIPGELIDSVKLNAYKWKCTTAEAWAKMKKEDPQPASKQE